MSYITVKRADDSDTDFYYRDEKLFGLVNGDGSEQWFDENGKLHRDGDLPAQVDEDGTTHWYKHGKLHRDGDLPSVILEDGTDGKFWYKNGLMHRDNKMPAYEDKYGDNEWWENGVKVENQL